MTGAKTARAAQEVRVKSLRRRGKLGRLGRRSRWTLCVGLSVMLVAFFAPITAASGAPNGRKLPRAVRTSSDQARHKLDKGLLQTYDKHGAGTVAVFVNVVGDARSVSLDSPKSRAPRLAALRSAGS